MVRREFLSQVASLLAAALAGGELIGCATTGAAGVGAPSPGAWLAEVDRLGVRLRNPELPAALRRYMSGARLRPSLFGDAFSALAGVSAFRDLPPELQGHPTIQDRLREDGETLGHAVVELTAYLERLSPEDRAARARVLEEQPQLLEHLRAAIVGKGRSDGAAEERIGQLTRILDRIAWRLTHQDPSLLIDSCIERVDRAAEHVGLDRQGAKVAIAPAWTPVGRPRDESVDRASTAQEREQSRLAGEVIKHVGQIVCLFGLLCAGVAGGTFLMYAWSFSILGFTLAAMIALVGLILVLVGAFMNNP